MVKPYMSIKLKDAQHYYLEDETIACTIDLRLEKILKDPIIKVSFKGRSSSHSNNARHHFETIFTTEKEISITKWNNAANLRKMVQIEFSVEVPNGTTIPSYKNLEGSDGGKVEYMIEACLETASFLKRSIQASHIILVPLIGKVNIGDDELQKPRESSIRWPKNEENANTVELSAWIPCGGCVRGKDVPIRVELKQPERYQPPKVITVELIRQEIIASSKDSLPDMTKQLEDKIVQKEEKPIAMAPGIAGNRLLSSSQVVVFSTPSNITPTISKNAKVMRLDYKLRVSVKIPSVDSGKDRELSVNLPIVIGTTGVSTIYDSGFESHTTNLYGSHHAGGSDGNNSVSNGYGPGSFYPPPISPSASSGFGYPPAPAGPGGFHMPEPHGFYPPVYPPNRFVLNPEQLAYTSSLYQKSEDSGKYESMPMPDFGGGGNNDRPFSPFDTTGPNNTPANESSLRALSPLQALPAQNALDSTFDSIYALPEMGASQGGENSKTGTITLSPTSSIHSRKEDNNNMLAAPARHPSFNKPNTPTPPQTPGIQQHQANGDRKILKPTESSSSFYSSNLFMESTISDGTEAEPVVVSPTNNDRKSLPTRVDPLLSLQ